MKSALILFTTIFIASCSNNVGSGTKTVYSNGIVYFRDSTTGLCFGKIDNSSYGGYEITSLACVPCDSLKKIGL